MILYFVIVQFAWKNLGLPHNKELFFTSFQVLLAVKLLLSKHQVRINWCGVMGSHTNTTLCLWLQTCLINQHPISIRLPSAHIKLDHKNRCSGCTFNTKCRCAFSSEPVPSTSTDDPRSLLQTSTMTPNVYNEEAYKRFIHCKVDTWKYMLDSQILTHQSQTLKSQINSDYSESNGDPGWVPSKARRIIFESFCSAIN